MAAGCSVSAAIGPLARTEAGAVAPADSGVFIGRRAELEALSEALEAARAGRPQVVSIEGDAGIGKTALVRRFLSTAGDVVVLRASGEEGEVALDFGVVSQLISSVRPPAAAQPLREAVVRRPPATALAVGSELLRMLGTVQDDGVVVVTIDDLHWADLPSTAALLFALRRLQGDRVLVLAAHRPGAAERLGESWARLLDDPERVQRLSLGGLSAPEVGALASGLGLGELPLASSERLRAHTAGQPLYLRALLRELPREALAADRGPLPAPHSFAETVLARLADAGGPAQRLVAAAAVAGPRCTPAFAGAVAGLADPMPALEEALDADLLRLAPTPAGEWIAFTHPLVRAAVYHDLSLTRRRALHLACAEQAAGAAALAHRVAASTGADDALADELVAMAEAEVAAGAPASAAEHLLWASGVAGSEAKRQDALLRAVVKLGAAGDAPAARRWHDAVLACRDSPRRSFTIAAMTASAGRLVEAEAALRAIIARADFSELRELSGAAISTLAIVYAYLGRGADAVSWAQQALESDPPAAGTEATAMQAMAMGLAMTGHGREGVALLRSLSPGRMDPGPFEPELLATRGSLKAWCGDLTGAIDDLRAAIRWAAAGLPLRSLPHAYGTLAEAEYHLGRWDDALTGVDVAVSLAQDTGQAWQLPFVHAVAGRLAADRGEWSDAAGHVRAALDAAQLAPLPVSVYYAAVVEAHLAAARGEWDAVLRATGRLRDGSAGWAATGIGRYDWPLLEAEALLGLGRLDACTAALDELEEALDADADGTAPVELCRLRGLLEHACGRPEAAGAAFRRGLEAAQAVRSPLPLATLQVAHGRFLRDGGDRRGAITALRAARERLDALGARPLLARCDAELAACGVRTAAGPDENGYGLTTREQVVAKLVASGLTNRQVAAELYLSTKAIEYHLGNIFAKVGIRSRHHLAARLADRDP